MTQGRADRPETRHSRGVTPLANDGQQPSRWTRSYRRSKRAVGWTEAQACQHAYPPGTEVVHNLGGDELVAAPILAALLQTWQTIDGRALRRLGKQRQRHGPEENELPAEAQTLAAVAEPRRDTLTRGKLLTVGRRQPIVLSRAGGAAVPVPQRVNSRMHPLATQTAYMAHLGVARAEGRTDGALAGQLQAELSDEAEAMPLHNAEGRVTLLSRSGEQQRTKQDLRPADKVKDRCLSAHVGQRAREHAGRVQSAGEVSAGPTDKMNPDERIEGKGARAQLPKHGAGPRAQGRQRRRRRRAAVRADGPLPRCAGCRHRGHIFTDSMREERTKAARPRGEGRSTAEGRRRGPTRMAAEGTNGREAREAAA